MSWSNSKWDEVIQAVELLTNTTTKRVDGEDYKVYRIPSTDGIRVDIQPARESNAGD